MKIGFSSFSFYDRLSSGRTTMTDVIAWVAQNEGEHLELATMTFSPRGQDEFWNLDDAPELVDSIRSASRTAGVELSGLCIPADFLASTDSDRRRQVDRVKHHIRLSDSLGIRNFRHDVVKWKYRGSDIAEFEHSLPALVDASKEVAQFAATYGITTSVENHGFYMNASERVRRLIYEVDEPNFATTLDVGNFLCVDEDPLTATIKNLPYASFVHLKDFYVRPKTRPLGDGWLSTLGGSQLLGSIIGHGDMPTAEIIRSIRESTFDGFVAIEFEGLEDSFLGCQIGIENTRRMMDAPCATSNAPSAELVD